MPIKPENEKLYPGGSTRSPEWAAIRQRILERAVDRCEGCKVPNRALVFRTDEGAWYRPTDPDHEYNPNRRLIKIVLTIAHFDHNPANNAEDNLRAWCQQCHNRHDQAHRQANARKTRRNRRADGDLFEESVK